MKTYKENLDLIESLKTFEGGDNNDTLVSNKALDDMKYIVKNCTVLDMPQPEIFPWAGGDGIQAEWDYEWYIEINSCDDYISILFIKDSVTINTHIDHIQDALLLTAHFLRK